VKYFFKHF